MFNHVSIDPDEVLRVRLPLLKDHGDKLAFAQPCDHHSEQGCAIYAARPNTCERFACALLKKLRDGHELAPLLAKATRTRTLARSLWDRLPPHLRTGGLWTLLGSVPGTEHPKSVQPELLLDLVELAARLRRDFEAPGLMQENASTAEK
jgi:hypothetical protein